MVSQVLREQKIRRLIRDCTLSLYFLFDMTYNSSHLHTDSINFSSILKTKTDSTRCKQTLEVQWSGRKTVHTIAIEQALTGPDRSATSIEQALTGPDRSATSIEQAQTGPDRSATSIVLAQQRRRSCQCEQPF